MPLQTNTVSLHPSVVTKIKEHGKKEKAKGGYEAVGFVASRSVGSQGVAILPLNNHSPDPSHSFFVEPWEQYRAERKLEADGYHILGVYHSHLNSEAMPSMTDHQMAWPEGHVFIYSVIFDDLKAYRERDGVLEPAELV